MSLQDIDDLNENPTAGSSGHRTDHGKIARGLKTLKAEAVSSASGTPSSDKVLSYNDGLKWQKAGEIAYASSNALFVSASGSPVAITGMQVTFATEDRPVNLDVCVQLAYSNSDALGVIEIFDGTNVIASVPLLIRGNYGTVKATARIAAGTASKTYTTRFWRVSGEADFEITPANPPSIRYMQAVTI